MNIVIESNGNKRRTLYNDEYDVLNIANVIGVDIANPSNVDLNNVSVRIIPSDNEEAVLAAKLMNYSHVMLQQQNVEAPFDLIKERLAKGQTDLITYDVVADWAFTFKTSDDLLFFVSVMRHLDLHNKPKWQVWLTDSDELTPAEGVKVKVLSQEHFVKHYFNHVKAANVAYLTQSKPNSDACKLLINVRKRLGKKTGLIKSVRTRMSDEEKSRRAAERVKDEDRNIAPESYQELVTGNISMKEFKLELKKHKKSRRLSAKTASKTVTGTRASITPAVRTVSPSVQARIDKVKSHIDDKRQ